jgi:translation initiation factor 1
MKGKKKAPQGGIVYSTDPDFNRPSEEPAQTTPEPSGQRLRIRLETKHRGGKTVTVVDGFQGTESALQELGRSLRNACGTGGSAKDGEIIVQGDHREKVRVWLTQKGYPAK